MPHYVVTWKIDVFEADNATEAAQKARQIQLNPDSIANVFEVQEHGSDAVEQIDLWVE